MITLDGYAASHRAVAKLKEVGTLPRRVRVRSCKYLNNVVEQDHRRIKQRIRPMLGFKRFLRGIGNVAKAGLSSIRFSQLIGSLPDGEEPGAGRSAEAHRRREEGGSEITLSKAETYSTPGYAG